MDLCVCITSKEKPNQTRTEEIKARVVPAGKGNQTTLYGQRVGKLEMNHEVKKNTKASKRTGGQKITTEIGVGNTRETRPGLEQSVTYIDK